MDKMYLADNGSFKELNDLTQQELVTLAQSRYDYDRGWNEANEMWKEIFHDFASALGGKKP